jgi:hypothetical protein
LDFSYLIFDLRVRSNFPLPGLSTASTEFHEPDILLRFDASPAVPEAGSFPGNKAFFESSFLSESGEPTLRVWKIAGGGLLRFDYADGTQFWIDANGRELWARWTENSSFEDAASYLMGPILGYMLRLRGVICLHASAVQCLGRAVVLVGPGGAGKSTSAAALALRGHAVISDDVVALKEENGAFYAVPAYPYLALWPESVRALYGPGRDFTPFSANFPKRILALGAVNLRFAAEPVPLDSIFLLDGRSNDSAAPLLQHANQREALLALVANTYANLLLDEATRAQEFRFVGRMVNRVPVRRLRAQEDLSRIDALCEIVEQEVAARSRDAAPLAAR